MRQVVVDTDVVSFIFKNHQIGDLYAPAILSSTPLISFMTIAELERWAIVHSWGKQKHHWLQLSLQRYTVVPSSTDLCRKWAEVMTVTRSVGRRMETADAFVAATALLYDVPLLTHNRRDYVSIPNLKLISHG